MRSLPSPLVSRPSPRSRTRSSGQILVLFAGSTVLFVLLCGIVVDVAYYWVGSLQAQRAADAAALAGSVYLPGDPTTARAKAIASATQNGFTVGGNTLTVTPVQDPSDARQLDVTITARVSTFFSRMVGIDSWPVSVTAKGVYVLPVPMGSPDAYYGVGNYSINGTTTSTTSYTSTSVSPFVSSTGTWTNPNNAWNANSPYSTTNTSNAQQQWSTFHIPAIQGANLDGVVVHFNAKVSAVATACQVRVDLSWNAGVTWDNGTPALTPNLTASDQAAPYYAIGSQASLSMWGNNHTWVKSDFTSNNFQVRLTYLKGTSCGQLSVNNLDVVAYSHTTSTTTAMNTTAGLSDGPTQNPASGTFLTSRGAWGAILTKGGNQQNGDAYAPENNGGYSPTNNVKYDANGYDYLVTLPSGGFVKVFDPGFCAMGSNGGGGSMGAGDHWIGTSGTPVSTYYTLWNTNGKPGMQGAWTEVFTSGTLFEGETGYDPANTGPGVANGSGPGGATSGCNSNGADTYHNTWWTVPTGNLSGGIYALQIQTTRTAHNGISADSSQNQNTNAENMFAVEAVGGGTPSVYGNGKMAVYNNLLGAGTQQFYLAQISRQTGAGKTALIDLFDPGDLSSGSTGTLQVLSPDGGTSHVVNFDYTTDSNCRTVSGASPCSGSNVNKIVTTTPSGQAMNNTWIHISIPLPSTYGQTLWNNGWWQIQYIVTTGGNDTTTWQVSVAGNPVHLLVP